jgi:DNA-binding beta-propeller fold protein YncE
MLTTTAGGRVWNFSHAIGRNAAAGAGFTQPMAVAAAPGGVLYVVSRGQERSGGVIMENKRLSKVTIDEEFIGEFGRTEFAWPAAIAVASDGSVYCADEAENLIAMYNSDGERLGQWGESGTEEGLLDGPCGLAFDSDDNVYVVECRNDRVQRFSKDGKFQAAWGGAGSGEGQFNHPWGITIDVKGDVYVADWRNNRVQKFTADGEFIMSFGPSEDEALKLDHPAGVAVDSDGDVYVTDWGNKRVQIFDPEGGVLASLVGDAQEFSKWGREVVESNPDVVKAYRRVKDLTPLGRFERPVGIAVDEEDRIIVTDSSRGRLQVYAKERDYLDPQFNL